MTWTLIGIGHHRLPRLNIPDAGCTVITGGDDVLAVGGKDGFIYQICVSIKTAQFFASGKIPKSCHAVAACCQHLPAIWREDSPTYLSISGSVQAHDDLPCRSVKNTGGTILNSDHNLFTIRRERSLYGSSGYIKFCTSRKCL